MSSRRVLGSCVPVAAALGAVGRVGGIAECVELTALGGGGASERGWGGC